MKDLGLIDAHVHLWRTTAQELAALPLPGRRDADRWGTPEGAIRMMDRCGIARLVFLNVLPTVEMIEAGLSKLSPEADARARSEAEGRLRQDMIERVRRQNAWACDVGAANERLVPFVGIQKLLGADTAVEEVRVGRERGAKGVKIQPGMNMFLPTDRELWPAYEEAERLRLPILTDSGTYGRLAPDGRHFGEPANFVEVLESFPRLTLVMAHFGSAYWDQRVDLALRYPNLCFDISGGFGSPGLEVRDGPRALSERDAPGLLRKVGIERFMFGTDGPAVLPGPYIEQVRRLALTEPEKHMLLSENALRHYAIK